MHASNQKQEVYRKLNRKLNCNGTGTKLQWTTTCMPGCRNDRNQYIIGNGTSSDAPSLHNNCVAVKAVLFQGWY